MFLGAAPRKWRASLLTTMADSLESDREGLVEIAGAETALGSARLQSELTRSILQFRLFAEAVKEGSFLEATIDHASGTVDAPLPEIRRMLVPVGPVAVFGASNFPFAFSVAGGDTASGLAAGAPVVVKAHSSHPLTSQRSFNRLVQAARSAGSPEGTISIVYGHQAGRDLVAHPSIKAASFTGSLSGGKALQAIIDSRSAPIPFFAELSSLNPLVVFPRAAEARSVEIANGILASVTGSGGQLCTKPGIVFLPATNEGRKLAELVRRGAKKADGHALLNKRIFDEYVASTEATTTYGADRGGFWVRPSVSSTSTQDLAPSHTREVFGPHVVLVSYTDIGKLGDAILGLSDSLTATIHADKDDAAEMRPLAAKLAGRTGRLIFNGFPTGVRVSWGQNHGGPWPSTNSQHTSVGVSAMRRFLRPLAWQNAPQSVLPTELHDLDSDIPRRVDGKLTLPATA